MKQGWPTRTLGEVCKFATGGTPSTKVREYWDGGDIPWVASGDVHKRHIFECGKAITRLGMDNSNARMLPPDSVLIALNGQGKTRGTVAMLRIPATCNQSVVCMTPQDRNVLSAEYLLLYLESRYQWIRDLTGDKDRRGLNVPMLRSIEIPLPAIEEQQRIVAIVDETFERIAVAKANAEQNVVNARAVFESERETVLSGDVGWDRSQLSDLCEIGHGFAFRSEYFAVSGEYVLLTPGNFNESGGYRDRGDKQKFYVGPVPDGFILREGDLLVAMTEQAAGLLGSPVLVPRSGEFLHNQRLGLVAGKPGAPWFSPFFFHVFNTARVRRSIHESASGVKVRHTSPTKIGQVEVAFPEDVIEQERIAEMLTGLETETLCVQAIYQRKIVALEALKKSLLNEAFSGNL